MRDAILPNSWRLVRLQDVTEDIRYGVNEPNDQTGKGPRFLRISDVNDDGELTVISPARMSSESASLDRYLLKFGDLLLARSGSVGRSFIAPKDFTDWVFASYFIRFRLKLSLVDPVFAGFFCRSPLFKDQVSRIARVVAQPNVNSGEFAGMLFPLPPLSEQQRVVEILQEAEEIRRLRAAAEAKTAELIPAIFFTHFQDEIISPHSHSHRLADFCVNDGDVKCGPFGTQLRQDEFTKGGVPLWGIRHVNSNFKIGTDEFISPEKAEGLGAYSLKPGDIVMTRKGTIGNCAIYPDNLPEGIMHSDLLRIRLDSSRFHPVFLSAQLTLSPVVEKQISSQSAGAVMPGINVTRLKELKLFVVDPNRQRLFAEEVNEVAALHSLEHRSRSIETHLLASLAAHAFSGLLTANWRETHQDQLAIEASERDTALKESGATLSLTSLTIIGEIEELLLDRTDGIYADLNREQRDLLREIERMFAGVDYGRYFTAEHVAADIKGTLHRHPQRIESHLALFAARGLIIPVSRPRDYSTGPAFAACYRLPIIEKQAISDEGNADVIDSDDIRGALMEAHRKLATGRI